MRRLSLDRRFLYEGCSIFDFLGSSPVLALTTNGLISLYYVNCTEDGIECQKQITTARVSPTLRQADSWAYSVAMSAYVDEIPVEPTALIIATGPPHLSFLIPSGCPSLHVRLKIYEKGGQRVCEHVMQAWDRPVKWKARCLGLATFWMGSVRSERLSLLTSRAPSDPSGTEHEPGTEGKVAVMEDRAARELALFSPRDALLKEEVYV